MNKTNLHNIFEHNDCLTEKQLLDYAQNNLSNKERNEVERHTIDCKFCADALEGFENISAIENYQNAKNSLRKPKGKNVIPFVAGIAAVFVIGLLIVDFLNVNDIQTAENHKEEKTTREDFSIEENLGNQTLIDTSSIEPKKEDKSYMDVVHTAEPEPSEILIEDDEEEDEEDFEGIAFNHEAASSKKYKSNEITEEKELAEHNNMELEIQFEDNSNDIEEVQETYVKDANVVENKFSATEPSLSKAPMKLADTIIVADQKKLTNIKSTEEKRAISLKAKAAKTITTQEDRASSISPFEIGVNNFNKKLYSQAVTSFELIKPKENKYYEAHLYLGKCFIQLKQKEKAKKSLNIALKGSSKIKKEAQKLLEQIK